MLGDVDEDLLPIGQFAQLARLSVKQLRHYDEIGLLRPACVDAATGYRYYRAAQARTALSIGLLRSLDVPLPVVGQVLSGSQDALESVRDSLEAELARRRRALASLERVMADGLPATQVRIVTVPAYRVALIRERAGGPSDIARATSAAASRLVAGMYRAADAGAGPHLAHADAAQTGDGSSPAHADARWSSGQASARAADTHPGGTAVATGGPQLIGLFPLDLSDAFDVAVALVLHDGWEAGGEARVDVLPGGTFAAATHIGPYDQISLTAHAVLAWCAERRHPMRGPIREVYVSDPARTPPDELITHLMIPLEEES
ncbi:MerR family transcriptional regulator [Nonomuraea guangzhouensis]|uniref:MerR family transcriptional regulator n=1 Tax=Nonomuraea guangzhouensis TaxID=1291555 RepID=A0ABW4G5G4_9ACTN|nr:MerR family transcriptional regulator [Nonomuraea guangzhouensis]